MAFIERYVIPTGKAANGGTNDTTDAWDFITGLANMTSGIRINVKAGNYSIGSGSLISYGPATNATASAPAAIRGYNSVTGDLTVIRNISGLLDTSNFPIISSAYQTRFQFMNYNLIESIKFSGGRSNGYIGLGQYNFMYNCFVEDNGPTTNASAIFTSADSHVVCCDVIRSNTDGNGVAINLGNFSSAVYNCVKGYGPTPNSTAIALAVCSHAIGNVISDYKYGIYYGATSAGYGYICVGNTMYNITSGCVVTSNSINIQSTTYVIADNHCTDSNKFLDHLYSGPIPCLVLNNRVRNITLNDSNMGDFPYIKHLTQNNGGGANADYISSTGRVLYLNNTAVGRSNSIWLGKDVGALQSPINFGVAYGG